MVNRPSEPPYDERVRSIDEQIAHLISQREQISNGHPGVPCPVYLDEWAEKFHVPMSALRQTFFALYYWHESQRRLEPAQFLRLVPVGRHQNHGNLQVIIPYVLQYANCSVIKVELHGACITTGIDVELMLIINGYDCHPHRGEVDRYYAALHFVVTPIIPDDMMPKLPMTVTFESHLTPPIEEEKPVIIPYTTVRFDSGD